MTILLFVQIVFVCLLGAMSPGPSMVLVINNSIFKDKFNGILTAIGHGLGIGIYALFAVIGIGIIIQTNLFIFNSIKVLSIIFLFYLGLQAIFKKAELDFRINSPKNGIKSFFQGLTISILNPKILIWFIAIYSQFMSQSNNYFFNISLILIASIVDTLWYVFLVNLVTSKSIFKIIKMKSELIQKIVGYFFILIALVLLLNLLR